MNLTNKGVEVFNAISEINWMAVLTATIANFLLGGLWFTVLFAKQYAVALGKENSPKQKPAPIYLIGPLICGFITTLTLTILFNILKIESMAEAISLGALVGFGFLATTTTNTAINPNIPRPLMYGLLSGSFFFISTLLVSSILFLFG